MTKTNRGLGCLILLALPFAGSGLFVAFLAAKMLWLWVDVRSWQPVPARIVESELISTRGDDSITYRVTAVYEYELDGVTYRGERVALAGGSDNVGSFHQDKHRELAAYAESGEHFRCFVDPDDPEQAVLFREMRWGLFSLMTLFATVFTGVGLGLMGLGLWSKRQTDEQELLVSTYPSQPWRWRNDWAEGRILASGRTRFLMPAIMAVFWNLVSMPLLFVLPQEVLEKRNHAALLGLLFPLVGLGLFVWAVRSFVRWQKFGDSVFEMSTFPGVVGGTLSGRVLSSVDLKPSQGFHLTLSCVDRVTTGSGKNRSTRERILWQEEQRIERELAEYDPTRSEIPVQFVIPYHCEPTAKRGDEGILWRLEVEAEVPGVDYAALFEVPVFKTAESRADMETTIDRIDPWQSAAEFQSDFAAHGIRSDLLSDGARRLDFGAARHKGPATVVSLFLGVWTGINVLLMRLDAPTLFTVVWGLFTLLLLYGALDLWFERRRIDIYPDKLVLSGGLFGLGRTRAIARSQIEEIRSVRGMQSGNKLYYRIQVSTLDGKRHVAATKIANLSLARKVIEALDS